MGGKMLGQYKRALTDRSLVSFFLLGFSLLVFFYFWYPQLISVDAAMYLKAGSMLLEGKEVFTEVLDINPPAIFYLSGAVVQIAHWMMISPIFLMKALIVILVSITSIQICQIASRYDGISTLRAKALGVVWLLVSCFTVAEMRLAEREQLFSLVYFPWALARLEPGHRCSTRLSSIACGAMACLKPWFVVMLVVVEIVRFRSHKKDASFFYWLAPILAYVLHWSFLSTAANRAFWLELLPDVERYYHSYDSAWTKIFFDATLIKFYFLFAVLLLCISRDRNGVLNRLQKVSVGLLSLSLLHYFLSGKGWHYQLIPSEYSASIGIVSLPFYPSRTTLRQLSAAVVFFFAVVFFAFAFDFVSFSGWQTNSRRRRAAEINSMYDKYSKSGDSVLTFAASPAYSMRLYTDASRHLGSRYLVTFPLSFFNPPHARPNYRSLSQMGESEKRFIRNIRQDIDKNRPAVLLFVNSLVSGDHTFVGFDPYVYFATGGIREVFDSDYVVCERSEMVTVMQRLSGSHRECVTY